MSHAPASATRLRTPQCSLWEQCKNNMKWNTRLEQAKIFFHPLVQGLCGFWCKCQVKNSLCKICTGNTQVAAVAREKGQIQARRKRGAPSVAHQRLRSSRRTGSCRQSGRDGGRGGCCSEAAPKFTNNQMFGAETLLDGMNMGW